MLTNTHNIFAGVQLHYTAHQTNLCLPEKSLLPEKLSRKKATPVGGVAGRRRCFPRNCGNLADVQKLSRSAKDHIKSAAVISDLDNHFSLDTIDRKRKAPNTINMGCNTTRRGETRCTPNNSAFWQYPFFLHPFHYIFLTNQICRINNFGYEKPPPPPNRRSQVIYFKTKRPDMPCASEPLSFCWDDTRHGMLWSNPWNAQKISLRNAPPHRHMG